MCVFGVSHKYTHEPVDVCVCVPLWEGYVVCMCVLCLGGGGGREYSKKGCTSVLCAHKVWPQLQSHAMRKKCNIVSTSVKKSQVSTQQL